MAQSAPVNIAPNSQWEIWSGVGYATDENDEGTGLVRMIAASASSTGTPEAATFAVTNTGQVKVGDLVEVSGPGVDPSLLLAPMRVTAIVPNRSLTVRVPLGLVPTISHAAMIRPIVVGNLAAKHTGDAADGWKKTIAMPIWRENAPANVPAGAYYSLGLTKDGDASEHVWTEPDVTVLAGRTVVFGIYVKHKIRNGSGTWSIFWNTGAGSPRTCKAMPVSSDWQWQECTITVPDQPTHLDIGVQLDGAAGDTYYLADPVLAVGAVIGGHENYTKPHELLTPVVHVSPITWINRAVTFPATLRKGRFGFTVDAYAETGGQVAPTVGHAWGQLEGIDNGPVQAGTGDVRVIAWYDRATPPTLSGSFLAQYVAGIKSFSTMDFPFNTRDLDPALRGTASIQTGVASDHWYNLSLEFDRFELK